ncbi:MAG: polyketide cyclase/dehydrase [Cyclobacteriaceae bacterium]|nr:polyketide cyclase/dehydrase [Cyclobacteriaceae bacterium]
MKSINNQAPVKCNKTITINASKAEVWNVMANIAQWPAWQKDIAKTKLNGPLKVGTTFDWKTGGAGIHSTLHTIEPGSQLGWTGKTFGLLAIHNWTLTEVDGKTQIFVEESMEGLLAGVFKKAFNKNLEKGMVSWLDFLKAECEK